MVRLVSYVESYGCLQKKAMVTRATSCFRCTAFLLLSVCLVGGPMHDIFSVTAGKAGHPASISSYYLFSMDSSIGLFDVKYGWNGEFRLMTYKKKTKPKPAASEKFLLLVKTASIGIVYQAPQKNLLKIWINLSLQSWPWTLMVWLNMEKWTGVSGGL